MAGQEHSVLMVCTANRVRSPMAEALLKAVVAADASAEAGGEVWRIESAGTWAVDGLPAMPLTESVLAEQGIDIGDHESRPIEHCPLESFNLILVMERGHREALVHEFPQIAGRVYLISEMTGAEYEITDPVAGTRADYRRTVEELRRILVDGLPRIRQLSAQGGAGDEQG